MATNSLVQTNTQQNRVQSFAFVIAVFVSVCFSICFVVSILLRFGQSCEIELNSRVNPNVAPAASLVRLPGIGTGKAEAIVAYRRDFSEKVSHKPVFQSCDDLQKVKGIGPKTVKNINEWLEFE